MSTDGALFSTHDTPVWRDRADFIINAALEESGRYEQLWVRQMADDRFEVCCIPFFVYDLALGDVVETAQIDGRPHLVDRVLSRSGRTVFRVFVENATVTDRRNLESELIELGCLLEWSSRELVAVDAADEATAQSCANFLYDREVEGTLVYETGRS